MFDRRTVEKLGGWRGYRVQRIDWPASADGTVEVHLSPSRKTLTCAQCGRRGTKVHETVQRRVRDLPMFQYRVVLVVPRRRLWCDHCGGPRLEQLDWLGRYQRLTNRFAEAISMLLRSAPISAIADFYALHWHTVKAVDKTRLIAELPAPDWAGIRYLAMDEFAVHKGHRYATVVIEPTRRQVLWIGDGRSRATAAAFFQQLPPGIAAQIQAVAIDMTTSYELEIRQHCPQAEIVYDLFHVIAKYGREVIDRVRVDEANRLRDDRSARRVMKSSRWLLLRNRARLKTGQQVKLDELLAANQALLTVYVLRDALKQLWWHRCPDQARAAWQQWHDHAMDSRIPALQRFAERLAPYVHGIVSRCRHRLHTSVLEGINNTIKVIKRRAYGYRDQDYFFLKIRAAFPGFVR